MKDNSEDAAGVACCTETRVAPPKGTRARVCWRWEACSLARGSARLLVPSRPQGERAAKRWADGPAAMVTVTSSSSTLPPISSDMRSNAISGTTMQDWSRCTITARDFRLAMSLLRRSAFACHEANTWRSAETGTCRKRSARRDVRCNHAPSRA